ncbi:MAG: AI-2E family transporter [Clostridiales bacterium]|nr:AI-2E family transporter [Candidatus Crickella equi]
MDKKLFKSIIWLFVIFAVFAWCVINSATLFGAIGTILKLVAPFFYGCMIAFVINVMMRPMERRFHKSLDAYKYGSKLVRPLAIVLSLVVVLGILSLIVVMVIPGFYESIVNFVHNVPNYAKTVNEWWASLGALAAKFGATLPPLKIESSEVVDAITKYMSESGAQIIDDAITRTSGILSGFVSALLAIIFAIYILATKETLGASCKRTAFAFLPEYKAQRVMDFAKTVDETFSSFVSGQCIEACCFGVLSFIGLMIFRFPYAGLIACTLGFTTLIPVFGAFIGGAIGFILIALTSPIKGLYFLIFLVVLQQLDNNLIYPRIVGQSVGLPGMLVLLAVTVGGSGFGLIGMLTSVPICAIIHGLYLEFISHKLELKGIEEITKEIDEEEV